MNDPKPDVPYPPAGPVGEPRVSPANACPAKAKPLKLPPLDLGGLAVLWWGKLRRAMLGRVLTGHSRRRHELRRGECLRCGACCQLGRICPSLEIDGHGLAACAKYDQPRDPTCRLYPTTESDLRDRDRISPGTRCGYYFADKPGQAERT
jgi:hypothetical protein